MNIDRFSILISLDFFYGGFVFYNSTDAENELQTAFATWRKVSFNSKSRIGNVMH